MRYQGKITKWKDDQGFGFITPNGSRNQVFVHIKSFENRQRRPEGNEIVTYEISTDTKGRTQAQRVAFVGEHLPSVFSFGYSNAPFILITLFLIFVAGLAFAHKLPFSVLWFYLVASAISFISYSLDKSAAQNDQWRISESTLHLFGVVGGWPGALAAQRLLRHKSKKRSFQIQFWATVILNCSALGWLFLSSGAKIFRSILGVM